MSDEQPPDPGTHNDMPGHAQHLVQARDIYGPVVVGPLPDEPTPRRKRPFRCRGWVLLAIALVAVVAITAVLVAWPTQTSDGSDSLPSSGGRAAFVWAQYPLARNYRPHNSMYVFNSANPGDVEIVRTNVGEYLVRLGGLNTVGGIAHVSAYGPSSEFCVIAGLSAEDAAEVARVLCFTADGRPFDTQFVLHFAAPADTGGRFSMVRAEPKLEPYQPRAPEERFDSTGGPAWVQRRAIGTYQVHIPASTRIPGEKQFFQVTAYGAAPARCKLAAHPSDSGLQLVVCHDASGELTDTAFGLSYHSETSVIGRTDRRFMNGNSAGGLNVMHTATGFYRVRLPGMGSQSGLVAAQSVGVSDAYCHVEIWFQDGSDLIADVRCWSAETHRPVNAEFQIAATW